MAKKKMPPQLVEYYKKKNSEGKGEAETDKGKKAEEMAEKGLKSAKAAKKYKDSKG